MSTKARLKRLRTVKAVGVAGDTFHVRCLSLRELEALDAYAGDSEGAERRIRYTRALLAAAVCEADGTAVFADGDDPDMQDVPTDALKTLTDAAADLNGMAEETEGDGGNG